MNLEVQIQSMIISFIYGLFVSFLYNLFYFILYSKNKVILVLSDLLFNVLLSLLFFYIMFKINYANIHPYFLLLLICGFFIGNKKTKVIRKNTKEKGW
jgi:hypothetical protein